MDIGSIRIVVVILMGIAVILFMIYLSTRSIVDAINHWGKANEHYQLKVLEELKRTK